MQTSKRSVIGLVAIAVAATLIMPAIAQAATIYVNSGVSGARLGMKDTTAAKKLGKVMKKEKDPNYEDTTWVLSFGKKVKGNYALYVYSDGHHKVFAFDVFSKSYKTKKKIHVGSTTSALKKAYKSLKKGYEGYYISGAHGRTLFTISKGKITHISVWSL